MVAAHPFQPAELVDEPVRPEDAPIDDEPETPEEAAAVAEARADTRPTVSHDELKRRLGL